MRTDEVQGTLFYGRFHGSLRGVFHGIFAQNSRECQLSRNWTVGLLEIAISGAYFPIISPLSHVISLDSLHAFCVCRAAYVLRRMSNPQRASFKRALTEWREGRAKVLDVRCLCILPDNEVGIVPYIDMIGSPHTVFGLRHGSM